MHQYSAYGSGFETRVYFCNLYVANHLATSEEHYLAHSDTENTWHYAADCCETNRTIEQRLIAPMPTNRISVLETLRDQQYPLTYFQQQEVNSIPSPTSNNKRSTVSPHLLPTTRGQQYPLTYFQQQEVNSIPSPTSNKRSPCISLQM